MFEDSKDTATSEGHAATLAAMIRSGQPVPAPVYGTCMLCGREFPSKELFDAHPSECPHFVAEPVKIDGQPETVPLTIERAPKPPPDPKLLPPTKQLHVERILDANGQQIGLRGVALPGNAIVSFELTGLINELVGTKQLAGWKHVNIKTEPRRGRVPRSSAKKKGN